MTPTCSYTPTATNNQPVAEKHCAASDLTRWLVQPAADQQPATCWLLVACWSARPSGQIDCAATTPKGLQVVGRYWRPGGGRAPPESVYSLRQLCNILNNAQSMEYEFDPSIADQGDWLPVAREVDCYDFESSRLASQIDDAIDKLVDAVNNARKWDATMDPPVECEPDEVLDRIREKLKDNPFDYGEEAELATWNEPATPHRPQ